MNKRFLQTKKSKKRGEDEEVEWSKKNLIRFQNYIVYKTSSYYTKTERNHKSPTN